MSERPRKAVIPAAGLGTRFLPATKSQPKEMLPVVDKPAIQYVVEEAVRVGLTDILVVTGRGKRAIEDHFDHNVELEAYLAESGRHELHEEIQSVTEMATIHYVRQREPLGLGHAVSVARDHVGSEPFAVLLPDDLLVDDSKSLSTMIEVFERYDSTVLGLLEVDREAISAYGCVTSERIDDTTVRVHSIIEKPPADEAPSNLAAIGRYVFTPEIFEALDGIAPGHGGEIQLTDAIGVLLERQAVYGCAVRDRHDIGDKLGFLRANVELALRRSDLGPAVRAFLDELGPSDSG